MATAPKVHRRNAKKKRRVDLRPGASARGYDSKWRRLRQWYANRHPLCEDCLGVDRVTPVQEVDHVQEFNGKDDPLRLDPDNLRSLCRSCHRKKHERTGRGVDYLGRIP